MSKTGGPCVIVEIRRSRYRLVRCSWGRRLTCLITVMAGNLLIHSGSSVNFVKCEDKSEGAMP